MRGDAAQAPPLRVRRIRTDLSVERGVVRDPSACDVEVGVELVVPIVDRNLLRMGIFELLHRDDIPTAATINEAVELAKLLSTEDSGRFVNGLLGRVAREHA